MNSEYPWIRGDDVCICYTPFIDFLVLKEGSIGVPVKVMQFLLNMHWTIVSPAIQIDGIFGPNTKSAVITFQRAMGLNPDGIVGPKTWPQLRRPYDKMLKTLPATISKDSTGVYVQLLQVILNLPVTGSYGPETEGAVISFQQSVGLNPDGIVGPLTWEAIRNRYW